MKIVSLSKMKLVLCLGIIVLTFVSNINSAEKLGAEMINITILYDNYVDVEGTEAEWGFSCLIEGTEKTILFDTGNKDHIFLKNIEKLNIDLKDIEQVVISHEHGDHTGGLLWFLERNPNVSVFVPSSFSSSFCKAIVKTGAKLVRVKEPVEICKEVYSTGEMKGRIEEQSLVLRTQKGLVVITGCSHPGIVPTVEKARNVYNQDVYLVFGGFHLLQQDESMIKDQIQKLRDLGVKQCGPTHCTGDEAIQLFAEAYGSEFIKVGTGKVITLK